MSNATQAAPALPLMDETYYRSRRRRQGLREDLNSFWFLLPILALFVILFPGALGADRLLFVHRLQRL